jgi:hypothetical protein
VSGLGRPQLRLVRGGLASPMDQPPVVPPPPVARLVSGVVDAAQMLAACLLLPGGIEALDPGTETGRLTLALLDAVHDLDRIQAGLPLGAELPIRTLF